jgi:hypothetical protein
VAVGEAGRVDVGSPGTAVVLAVTGPAGVCGSVGCCGVDVVAVAVRGVLAGMMPEPGRGLGVWA